MVSHPFWQLLAGLIAGAVAWAIITSESFPRVPSTLDRPQQTGRAEENGGGGEPRDGGRASNSPTTESPGDAASILPVTGAVDATLPTVSLTLPTAVAAVIASTSGDESTEANGCQPPPDESSNPVPESSTETVSEPSPVPTPEESVTDSASEPSSTAASIDANTVDDSPAIDDNPPTTELPAAMMQQALSGGTGMVNLAPLSPEELEALRVESLKKASLSIGFFGALLCGLFGLVEGISRRSLIAPLAGLLVGLFLGAAGGGLAGLSGMSLYHVKFDDLAPEYLDRHPKIDELRPILEGMVTYATMWGIVGVAAGLSMSLLSRRPKTMLRSVTGAVIGGVLGGVLYATLEAWAFPLATEGLVVPRGTQNGLLWALLPAGLIGLLGSWQGRVQPKAKGEGNRGKAVRPAAAH